MFFKQFKNFNDFIFGWKELFNKLLKTTTKQCSEKAENILLRSLIFKFFLLILQVQH